MTKNANAPVETRHLDEAALFAGYQGWTHGFRVAPDQCSLASLRAHAQTLANNEQLRCDLEAANNRLAEIERIAVENCWAGLSSSHDAVAALASGHTPSPCPSCAAKDEAMVEINDLCKLNPTNGTVASIQAIAARFIIPPADPVAEALKAVIEVWYGMPIATDANFPAALAELKSRLALGGA